LLGKLDEGLSPFLGHYLYQLLTPDVCLILNNLDTGLVNHGLSSFVQSCNDVHARLNMDEECPKRVRTPPNYET
jgi:hypothetical protein